MREKAVLFGERQNLVGIVTQPPAGAEPSDRPALLILNAGLVHRVGPNRIHVQIARELAAAGFTVMRFDFSGIGDSGPRTDGLSFAESALADVREAMDYLARSRSIETFVLFGICSGADIALGAGCQDRRVSGAFLVDLYNLTSFRHYLYTRSKRILSPRGWLRLLLGRSEVWSDARTYVDMRRAHRDAPKIESSRLPPARQWAASLRSLADRGAQLCLAYTDKSPAYLNYRRLFRRAIRSWSSRDSIHVEYIEGSNHVFTLLCNQSRLVRMVREWVCERVSPAARAPVEQGGAETSAG